MANYRKVQEASQVVECKRVAKISLERRTLDPTQ